MDVVVDQVVAVLQVLAFGDAVGADQDVDFAGLVWIDRCLFLGTRREQGQQTLEIVALAAAGHCSESGRGGLATGDLACMYLIDAQQITGQVVVQVIGRIGKRSEDQHLLIAGVDGRIELAGDEVFQVLQFGIFGRSDLGHFTQKFVDEQQIGLQILLPRRQIHVFQADLDFLAYGDIARHRQVVIVEVRFFEGRGDISKVAGHAGLIEEGDLVQCAAVSGL